MGIICVARRETENSNEGCCDEPVYEAPNATNAEYPEFEEEEEVLVFLLEVSVGADGE